MQTKYKNQFFKNTNKPFTSLRRRKKKTDKTTIQSLEDLQEVISHNSKGGEKKQRKSRGQDAFPAKYKLLILNQKETENFNLVSYCGNDQEVVWRPTGEKGTKTKWFHS